MIMFLKNVLFIKEVQQLNKEPYQLFMVKIILEIYQLSKKKKLYLII